MRKLFGSALLLWIILLWSYSGVAAEPVSTASTTTVTVISTQINFWWVYTSTTTTTAPTTVWATATTTQMVSTTLTAERTVQVNVTRSMFVTVTENPGFVVIHEDFSSNSSLWRFFGNIRINNRTLEVRDGFIMSTVAFKPSISLEMTVQLSTGKGMWGFSDGVDEQAGNWIVFLQNSTGLFTVSSSAGRRESYRILSSLSGRHVFRIDWAGSGIVFFIDGLRISRHTDSMPKLPLRIVLIFEGGCMLLNRLTCLSGT